MMVEFSYLKQRAKEFWEEVEDLNQKGKYNLAAFHLEQAIQLWIKYLIGTKIGDWPKTHYLSELIKEFAKAWGNEQILEFYREKELFFENLEDAYFTSRYFPKVFTQNGVGQLIENSKAFLKFTEEITKEQFFQ